MGKTGSYDQAAALTGAEEITVKQSGGSRRTSLNRVFDEVNLPSLEDVPPDTLTGVFGVNAGGDAAQQALVDVQAGLIPKSLVDAAGDLLVGTADNTVGRLAKGTALQYLRTNAAATALQWATLDLGFALTDLGQARITSTAELGLQAAPFSITANTLVVGDRLTYVASIILANLTGGSVTFRLRPKFGGTALLDDTITVTALSGIQVIIRSEIFVESLTGAPSPVIHHATVLHSGSGTAAGIAWPSVSATSAPLTPATNAAIAMDTTVVMSAATAGIQSECTWASLSRVPARII